LFAGPSNGVAIMTSYAQIFDETVDGVEQAIGAQRWSDLAPELDAVADQAVGAVLDGRDDDVMHAAERIEPTYSRLLTGHQLVDAEPDARIAAGMLRGMTKFLSVAARRRRAPRCETMLHNPNYRPLADALFARRDGLTGRELAHALHVTEETIARKLPELR